MATEPDWADKLADKLAGADGRQGVAACLRADCIPRERVTRQIEMLEAFARFTPAENQHARATAIHALQATLEDDTDCDD